MDNSLKSLLNTPHFTSEIQDYLLEQAENRKYLFKRNIPIDQMFECFDISKSTPIKESQKDKNQTIEGFLYIFEKTTEIGLLKTRILNKIFENIDIYNLYLYSPLSSSNLIYTEALDNINFFDGEPMVFKTQTLSETESFKLCKSKYYKTKDLMFLIIFCMSISTLEHILKRNLSYSSFIENVIEIKKQEKEMVFSV